MEEPARSLRRSDRAAVVLLVVAAASIAVAVWWFGMADASMTGCGGG
jgi:hypothetical protein